MSTINLIGVRIANHRKKRDLSLTQLANGIISVSYLSNIEHGRKTPSIETLLHLADSLNLDAKELILDEEQQHSDQLKSQFEHVFNTIINEDFTSASKQLNTISKNYSLTFEASEMEICYHLLHAILALKEWNFSKFDRIHTQHLASLDYRLLFNQTKLYYQYLCAIKEHLDMHYNKALDWFSSLLEPQLPMKIACHVKLYVAITAICDCQYEDAIQTLEELMVTIHISGPEEVDKMIPVSYLLGFAYYHIDFYKFAQQHLTKARDLLPTSAKMTQNYQMVILFWLSQTTAKLEEPDSISTINNQMYQLFIDKFNTHEKLVRNDYLPLADLLVYYGESQDLVRAKKIAYWFSQVNELPTDLHFHMEYGKALIAYFEGDFQQFEHYLIPLMAQLDCCNNPALLVQIKIFLSQFYAKNKKYKRSYELMLGNKSRFRWKKVVLNMAKH